MDFIEYTKSDMRTEEELIRIYRGMIEMLPKGDLVAKNRNGNIYYYMLDPETGR